MKLLLIISLLCINNASAPPDTSKQTDQKRQQPAQQKQPQKQQPASNKSAAKKPAKTPMPFYPSPVLVDLF